MLSFYLCFSTALNAFLISLYVYVESRYSGMKETECDVCMGISLISYFIKVTDTRPVVQMRKYIIFDVS